MNGKPGDDPLLDILAHNLEVYGPEADELIRKIRHLSSEHELREWWEREIGRVIFNREVVDKAKVRYAELLAHARESGWEVTDTAQNP